MNLFSIFLESGTVAQIIMIILVIFSIWSWAICFKKFFDFAKFRRTSNQFLSSYRFHKEIKDWEGLGHQLSNNSYGRILASGLEEFKKIRLKARIMPQSNQEADRGVVSTLADNIRLAMERTKISEISRLEGSLPIMATFVTASPFLGLLGTVWGILEAFQEIRTRGSAHITVVAPGISDALVTTVYGLLVAIPALIFFNIFRNRVNKCSDELDKFISEIFAYLRKELFTTIQ